MKASIARLALAAILLASSTLAQADDSIQRRPLQFAKGTSTATVNASLKGDQTIDYTLLARAGQTMSVALKSSNLSNYFNVLPPGSTGEAIFVGSSGGDKWHGVLAADGEYTVRVYLMRNAARRNETAKYTLTVGVVGHAKEASTIPAPVLDSEQNLAEAFVLSTNEPFWKASVDGNKLELVGLDGKRTLVVDSNQRLFDGRHVMAHDSAGTLEVRITERSCQDSMSGADFPYTGKMAFDGGKEIFGCARAASDPPPGEPSNNE